MVEMEHRAGRFWFATIAWLAVLFVPGQVARAASYTEDWTVTSWRAVWISAKPLAVYRVPGNTNLSVLTPDIVRYNGHSFAQYGDDTGAMMNDPAYPSYELSAPICLGPASWRVTGQYDGRSYTENWTGADWVDSAASPGESLYGYSYPGGSNISLRYGTTTSCLNNDSVNFQVLDSNFETRSWVNVGHSGLQPVGPWISFTAPTDTLRVVTTGLYGGLVLHYGRFTQVTQRRGLILFKSGISSYPSKWEVNGDWQ